MLAATPDEVATELLAIRNGITVAEWTRTHPADTFSDYPEATRVQNVIEAAGWCTVATGTVSEAGTSFTRSAFFAVPDADTLRLPADDGPHPELAKQCVLGEVLVESQTEATEETAARIQAEITRVLGEGERFRANSTEPYALIGSSQWGNGQEWRSGGSRWVLASARRSGISGVALTAIAQQQAAAASRAIDDQLREARRFAGQTGLPEADVQRMRRVIEEVEKWQHTAEPKKQPDMEELARFLVRWVSESRGMRPSERAAALYAADTALGWLPLYVPPNNGSSSSKQQVDVATASLRQELGTAGAHFSYDELGGAYEFSRDWMQAAFRTAPDSEAGQQAFLFLLNASFEPGCCCSGETFEDVIRRAPQYLQQHPKWTIRADVLLAIGDAYRDIIGVANGANGDPFGDAAQYKPKAQEAYHEALRYYREAIRAAPRSDAGKEALRRAWSLEAGFIPYDTRFVCIYD